MSNLIPLKKKKKKKKKNRSKIETVQDKKNLQGQGLKGGLKEWFYSKFIYYKTLLQPEK